MKGTWGGGGGGGVVGGGGGGGGWWKWEGLEEEELGPKIQWQLGLVLWRRYVPK